MTPKSVHQASRDQSGMPRVSRRKPTVFAASLAVFVTVAVASWLAFGRLKGSADSVPVIQELIRERQYDEAGRRLERLLTRSPEDGASWLTLGGLRGVQGRDDEALAAFARVKGPTGAVARARALVGEIHLNRHEAAAAESALREAVDSDPSAVEPRRRLVYLLELERRADEARVVLWDLYRLARDPRHLITLVGMTLSAEDSRDPKPELNKFLARTPDDPLLRRARGLVFLAEGRPLEARRDLEAAFEALDDDPVGRLALADCRLAARESDAAEAALGPEPTTTRRSISDRWWFLKGRVEQARGRHDAAVEAWRHATGPGSHDREALYNLGQALVRKGKAAEARPLLDRAEAVRARGVALIRDLDRCLREGPNADTFERVARLSRESGLEAEARAWYGEVIRLDPSRREAQLALAESEPARTTPVVPRSKSVVATKTPDRPIESAVETRAALRFEDISARSGLVFQYDSGASPKLYLPDTMGGGVGLIDYDGDGRLDVYFVNGCPLPVDPVHPSTPNKLFRNRVDGTFEDVTARAGVAGHGYGMGCCVADYDNDGDDDLYVTGLGRAILYRNRGDGTFEDVTSRAGVGSDRWTTASGFGDLDGDGDLDLVVVTYVESDPKNVPDCRDPLGKPMHCPPGHFPAQTDHLFRNNGDGTFTEFAKEAGFDVPAGLGLGLAIVDLDGDGKLDVFVANDAAPNFFFRNLGGLKFEEVGVTAGLAYDGTGRATASMGVIADDLDGDGRVDIFHTNFLNEPNTLHSNLGGGLFDDTTLRAGLDAPSRPVTGFGTAALDVDNDGKLDVFVANGHVDDRPWAGHPMAQRPHLYHGAGRGRYELVPPPSADSYFARTVVGRGAAAGDLDGDGRVDLVVVHRDAPAAFLKNVTEGGHWIGLRLIGASPRTPIGARVSCTAGGRTSVRWLAGGTSYLSSNDPRVFFGLGTARTVDRLEVRWPSGAVRSWERLPADRVVELREEDGLRTGAAPR
jgi:tetratricopeptide (TPR) repeat protein